MIQLSINANTVFASRTGVNAIKAGGLVPVLIEFTASPGDEVELSLALSSDAVPASVAAYLDSYERQNETTFTGWLDANDPRLLALISGAAARTVQCEVAWVHGGRKRICPNIPISVQRPIVTGPASSEGGPVFYTAPQVDAKLLEKADLVGGKVPAAQLPERSVAAVVSLPAASGVVPLNFVEKTLLKLTLEEDVELRLEEAPEALELGVYISNPAERELVLGDGFSVNWLWDDPLPAILPSGAWITLVYLGAGEWKGAWGE